MENIKNSLELYDFLNSTNLTEELQRLQLLPTKKKCPKCRSYMKVCGKVVNSYFMCKKCKKTRTALKGTFFEKAKLKLKVIIEIIYYFSHELSTKQAAAILNLSQKTIIQTYKSLRDITSFKLLQWEEYFTFGGPGCNVQIELKNINKCQSQKWLLGIYDVSRKRGVVQYVADRDPNTIIPLIKKYVMWGTIISTDNSEAYHVLNQHGYTHQTIDCFTYDNDPKTAESKNHLVGFWTELKCYLREKKSLNSSLLPQHLDEFMFRKKIGKNSVFFELLKGISECYRVE